MSNMLQILLGVSIAALIGGMTNYVAIKMLFHPKRAWKIGGKTVPLTPGVIPKRKEEMARSLGKVVGEYLVTSEGLRTVIRGERMREMLTNKLLELIAKHLDEAETAESLILRFVRRERYEQWIRTSEDWTRENFFSFLHKLWERGEWRLKPIGQWTHQFAFREQLPEKWASWLIEMAEEELRSARGEAFVQDIVTHFLERGGWLGILAELMTDTQKLSLRLRAMLLELLKSPNTKSRLTEMLSARLHELEQLSVEQLIEKMSGTDAWTWVKQNAQSIVKPESWPRKLLTVNIAEWWPEYKTWLEERVPDLSRWILAQVDERVEALVRSINLPELVEREVIRFPVGRLEDLILKVTGKEFRAITWFGALIGGLIGFVQSVLILYVFSG